MKKLTLKITVFSIIFKILLEIIYVNYLNFEYPDTFILDNNYLNYLLSWVFFIVFLIPINKMFKSLRTSSIIIVSLFYISYVPTIIHFAFASLNFKYFLIFQFYWGLLVILVLTLKNKNLFFRVKKINIGLFRGLKKPIYVIILLFSSLFIVYTLIKVHGRIYIHFGLSDVYNLRFNEQLEQFSVLYSMLLNWIGGIIIPFVAVTYFKDKKYVIFTILLIIQLLAFSIAGHKMYLFIIPAGLIAPIVLNKNNFYKLPMAFSLMSLVSLLEPLIIKTDSILNYLVRRVFFIPALLSSYYYEYFSQNRKLLFFEDMIFSRIAVKVFGLTPYYELPASQVIGLNYFGRPEMLANNGMFGYGYADAGIIGVVLSVLLLVVVLAILDYITSNYSSEYIGIIVVFFTIGLLSVSVNTVIYMRLIPLILISLFKPINQLIEKND